MIDKFLYWWSGRKPIRFIQRDDSPYMERYYIGRAFGRTYYLHRFVGADGDKEVHDHPWDSFSIVLKGAYIEERMLHFSLANNWDSKYHIICAPTLNVIKANDFHRITSVTPNTWTLFVHKERVPNKGWGFLRDNGILFGIQRQTTYYQFMDVSKSKEWWKDAPLGRDADRQPLDLSHIQ